MGSELACNNRKEFWQQNKSRIQKIHLLLLSRCCSFDLQSMTRSISSSYCVNKDIFTQEGSAHVWKYVLLTTSIGLFFFPRKDKGHSSLGKVLDVQTLKADPSM